MQNQVKLIQNLLNFMKLDRISKCLMKSDKEVTKLREKC